MTVEEHARGYLDRLDADNASPALVVWDGRVGQPGQQPPPKPPYVLVYTSLRVPGAAEQPDMSNLNFTSTALICEAICHSVGATAAGARAVQNRVRAALLDVTPTVSGRSCSPIRCVDAPPMRGDEETGTDYFDAVDSYEFRSVPG